jgi:2-polyprenyl-3-methyl-5-hydroxy-6-metoxy-1,4-benzoquinol methylase
VDGVKGDKVFINIVSSESIMQPSKTVSLEVILMRRYTTEMLNILRKFDLILVTEVMLHVHMLPTLLRLPESDPLYLLIVH